MAERQVPPVDLVLAPNGKWVLPDDMIDAIADGDTYQTGMIAYAHSMAAEIKRSRAAVVIDKERQAMFAELNIDPTLPSEAQEIVRGEFTRIFTDDGRRRAVVRLSADELAHLREHATGVARRGGTKTAELINRLLGVAP